MTAVDVLFPLGMRLTTWLCVVAFVILAARRRDPRVLGAGCVWLLGFEAVFDVSREAVGKAGPFGTWALPLVVGVFTLAWFSWHGLWPSGSWAFVTAVIWVVWLGLGFPANQHTLTGFSWTAEVLNVLAKTAWAFAYFRPFLGAGGEGRSVSRSRPSWRLGWLRSSARSIS